MFSRSPRVPGDNASEDENADEQALLSAGHVSAAAGTGRRPVWTRWGRGRQYAPVGTPPPMAQGAPTTSARLCSLKGALQAAGLLKREVRYLPRRVPLDGTLSAAATLAGQGRGGWAGLDEGLVAAHAIPNIVRNQKYRAVTFVFVKRGPR